MTPLLMSKSRADLPASAISQSSAMMPLTWHLGILVAGTVGAAAVGAPTWLLALLGGLTGVTALLSWTTYVRLIRTDRDALRRVDTRVPSSSTERAVIAGDTGELRGAQDLRRLPGEAG
jgi:hypothetical protein